MIKRLFTLVITAGAIALSLAVTPTAFAAPVPLTYTPTDVNTGCTGGPFSCSRDIQWTLPQTQSSATVVYSVNNPPAWNGETGPGGGKVYALSASSDGTAWGVTQGGGLYKRNPATGTWSFQDSSTGAWLFTVDAISSTQAWIGGQFGFVGRTTDGTNWSTVSPALPTGNTVTKLRAISNSNVWVLAATASSSTLYQYNGSTWLTKWSNSGDGCEDFTTADGVTIVVTCNHGHLYRSGNAMATPPTLFSTPNTVGPTDDYFTSATTYDGVTIYAGGIRRDGGPPGLLYRSTNGGVNWTDVSSGTPVFEKFTSVAADKFWYAANGTAATYDFNATPKITNFPAAGGGIARVAVPRHDLIITGSDTNTYSKFGMPGSSMTQTLISTTTSPVVSLSGLDYGKTIYYAAESDINGETYGEFGTPFNTPVIDSTPPTISWTTPNTPGLYYRTCPLALGGIAGDNVGVTGVSYTDNGGPSLPATGTTSWSLTMSCAQLNTAKNHTLVATATDGTNQASATTSFIFDNTPPSITISAPATVTVSTVDATGNFSDNDLVTLIELQTNGGAWQTVSTPNVASGSWQALGIVLQPGNNTVTVRATDKAGNSFMASTVVTYNVPTFNISAHVPPPTTATINAGSTATFKVDVTSVFGFNNAVALSATSNPALNSGSITIVPSTINLSAAPSGTADVNFITTTTTNQTTYNVTVTGTYGSTSKSVTFVVNVNPAPDFSFTVNPVSNTPFTAGGSTNFTLTISGSTTYTYPGTMTFTTGSMPAGVSASFTPLSGNPSASGVGTATMTITATAVVTNAPIVITANDGTISHTFTIYLTTTAPPDFSVAIQPATQSVTAGDPGAAGTTFYNLTVTALNGFTGTVHLAAATNPADMNFDYLFSLNDFVPSTSGSVVTVNVTAHSGVACAPPSSCVFLLNVTGTAGSPVVARTATADLVVTPDLVPPVISNPAASPDVNSATISWQTNEPADSLVEIYTDASFDPATRLGSQYLGTFCTTTCHTINYTGLNASTDYWYAVTSTDQAYPTGRTTTVNNVGGVKLHFKTLAAPDTTPATLVITQPVDGATVVGGVRIEGTGSDDNPMARIQLKIQRPTDPSPTIDTTILCPASTTCPFTYIWNTMVGPVPNGTYVISVIAISSTGPPSSEQSITITVGNDVSAPTLLCLPGQVVCEPEAIQTSLSCVGAPARCSITIHWLTDDSSTTEIEYGLAVDCSGTHTRPDGSIIPCNYTDFQANSGMVTDHVITLTNLEPNQLYHYRITSCNVSNLCTN